MKYSARHMRRLKKEMKEECKARIELLSSWGVEVKDIYVKKTKNKTRRSGIFSGGFGGPYMYVFSPSSTKPKYRVIKMKKKVNLQHSKCCTCSPGTCSR